jgi:hypothetical protein
MNPRTGLPEFYEGEGNSSGNVGGDEGGGFGGAFGYGGAGYGGMDSGPGPDGNGGGNSIASAFGPMGAGMAMAPNGFMTSEQASNRADANAILSDMGANARHNENIGSGGPGTGYKQDEAPQGFFNRQRENAKVFGHNFGVDPIGTVASAITPSWSTALGLLGMMSPMPGGMMIGRQIGGLADKYGFNTPSDAQMATANPAGGRTSGGITEEPAASPGLFAGLGNTEAMGSQILNAQTNTPQYDMSRYFSGLSDRGVGGRRTV